MGCEGGQWFKKVVRDTSRVTWGQKIEPGNKIIL